MADKCFRKPRTFEHICGKWLLWCISLVAIWNISNRIVRQAPVEQYPLVIPSTNVLFLVITQRQIIFISYFTHTHLLASIINSMSSDFVKHLCVLPPSLICCYRMVRPVLDWRCVCSHTNSPPSPYLKSYIIIRVSKYGDM